MSARSSYSALSDSELLQKLIGVKQARKLYQGSLAPLFASASSQDMLPERCMVARELVQRWLNEELRRDDVLSEPTLVKNYLRMHFAGMEHEAFVALFLDTQHRLIVVEELFRGTLSQTSVYPREVVKAALRANAAAIIFAHNHPSGVAEPSKADEQLTKMLKQALALIDVRVLDHFIVAGASTLSFAEKGFMW